MECDALQLYLERVELRVLELEQRVERVRERERHAVEERAGRVVAEVVAVIPTRQRHGAVRRRASAGTAVHRPSGSESHELDCPGRRVRRRRRRSPARAGCD